MGAFYECSKTLIFVVVKNPGFANWYIGASPKEMASEMKARRGKSFLYPHAAMVVGATVSF